MGTDIAESKVIQVGDVGGTGISRFRWVTQSGTAPSVTDCNTALAAIAAFYGAIKTLLVPNVQWQFQRDHIIYDSDSAEVQTIVNAGTVPGAINGTASVYSYVGGTGMRVNWKTGTVHNRRFIRSSTYLVPMANIAFTSGGSVLGSAQATVGTAASNLIAAMLAGNLNLVAWGRPPKGTLTGGHYGAIISSAVPSMAASLRSRRE